MLINEKDIKFSVIIPVYNVEAYLEKCLDSVLQQDIEQYNYEIILINDGSTDGSFAICEEYKKHFKNIILINQENQGLSIARNRGLEVAKGKYIIFVDSDDYIQKNIFSVVYKEMEKRNLDMLHINTVIHGGNQESVSVRKPKRFKEKEIVTGVKYISKYGFSVSVCVWAYIYRREFLNDKGIIFTENLFHEDCEWMVHCFPCCERIGYLDVNFYHYVLSNGSIMRGRNVKKSFDLIKIAELINIHAEGWKKKEFRVYHAIKKYTGYIIWSSLRSCVQQGFSLKVLLRSKDIRLQVLKYGRLNKKYKFIFILIKMHAYRLAEAIIKQIIKIKSNR